MSGVRLRLCCRGRQLTRELYWKNLLAKTVTVHGLLQQSFKEKPPSLGVTVFHWQTVERSNFLFTNDDDLADTALLETPVLPDNVVFDAGYFVEPKGKRRSFAKSAPKCRPI